MTEISTDVYKADINSFTHVYIAIASMFMAWFLCCLPAMKLLQYNDYKKYGLIVFTVIIYCIVIPIIMTVTRAIYDTISQESIFAIIKMFSVCGCILLMTFYSIMYTNIKSDQMGTFQKIMSFLIVLVLIGNILEACWVSYVNKDSQEFDGVSEVPEMNIILFSMGLMLCVSLIIGYFVTRNQSITAISSTIIIKLVSGLSWSFILGYTFWNLAYRIQLIENTSVLIFLLVSLILPIIAHYSGMGDWLQIRGFTLLFTMIVTLGIAPDNGSELPMYNLQGYNKKQDNNDSITVSSSNKYIKIILLVLGMIFTVMSLFKSTGKFEKYLI